MIIFFPFLYFSIIFPHFSVLFILFSPRRPEYNFLSSHYCFVFSFIFRIFPLFSITFLFFLFSSFHLLVALSIFFLFFHQFCFFPLFFVFFHYFPSLSSSFLLFLFTTSPPWAYFTSLEGTTAQAETFITCFSLPFISLFLRSC